jgi:hypothetical protein
MKFFLWIVILVSGLGAELPHRLDLIDVGSGVAIYERNPRICLAGIPHLKGW